MKIDKILPLKIQVLYRVEGTNFAAGFITQKRYVVKSAPILKALRGMRIKQALRYCENRKWEVIRYDYYHKIVFGSEMKMLYQMLRHSSDGLDDIRLKTIDAVTANLAETLLSGSFINEVTMSSRHVHFLWSRLAHYKKYGYNKDVSRKARESIVRSLRDFNDDTKHTYKVIR